MNKVFTKEQVIEASTKYFKGDVLAAEVFTNKYAMKDDQLRYLEDNPQMMHKRMAKEFFKIESKFPNPMSEEEIFNMFDGFKEVIAGGSVMFGVGNTYQKVSLSNCVHGESLIYTREYGLIKMKDIKEGMHVLTHKNRFKKVLKHISNGIKETYVLSRTFGNKRISVTTEQEMGRFLCATPEHKVLTVDGEWKEIQDIFRTHQTKLLQPKLEYNGEVPDLFSIGEGKHVFIDKDFCWMAGLYLAEGAIKEGKTNHPSVYFTVSSDETNYADKISLYSEKILGYKAWTQIWNNYNFIQINIFNPNFAILMKNIFGSGFDKKRLPEWVFGLSEENKISLIDGFLCGDATNYESFDDERISFSIANPTLAYELGLLARTLNKNARFNFMAKGKLIKHRTVSVTFSEKQDVVRFTKSPVMVEVFDIEVEDDNSFVAGDIICHNCFVIDTVDSYGGICRADERIAQIAKRRGGAGIDITPLRPKGTATKNSALTTDGIVVFMDRFSNTAREVAQSGRRGALMISISVHHPEILNFIKAKRELNKVTGANISVRVTDEFMKAVKGNKKYNLRWPVDAKEPTISEMIDAKMVWNEMIKSVYFSAEPGILFWDNIIRNSPADSYADLGFKTIGTNPCGELPLPSGDACRLMSINLLSMVDDPFTNKS